MWIGRPTPSPYAVAMGADIPGWTAQAAPCRTLAPDSRTSCACFPAGWGFEVGVGEVGAACGADGVPGEVGVDAVEVDCCGAEDVGQGCCGLVSVSAAADAGGADGLGDRALEVGVLGEAPFPGVGFLRDALLLGRSRWSGNQDQHIITGAADFEWNGGVNNPSGSKDKDLSRDSRCGGGWTGVRLFRVSLIRPARTR